VSSPGRILILDCGEPCCKEHCCDQLATLIPKSFEPNPIRVSILSSSEFLDASLSPDLVILRIVRARKESDPIVLLGRIRQAWPAAPIFGLYCFEEVSRDDIVNALQNGLDDYVCCPSRDIDLIPRLRRLVLRDDHPPAIGHPSGAGSGLFRHDSLVGTSECFLQKLNLIPRLADSDATLLVTGETGTGKELFAQAIHYHSLRKRKPFIPVNCSALPDQLFENELFGHTKGAYTHASTIQTGLVTEAEGGTLFLDEIDALTPPAQTKLLRFLQNGEFRPLGSSRSQKADIRIIAATNANMRERVTTRLFREDLYYRLNVLVKIFHC
jgi:two-component system response regulator GlrR